MTNKEELEAVKVLLDEARVRLEELQMVIDFDGNTPGEELAMRQAHAQTNAWQERINQLEDNIASGEV